MEAIEADINIRVTFKWQMPRQSGDRLTMKVLIVYYSTYGHVHQMAEAVAEGVKEIGGVEAVMRRVPETLPDEVLEKMGAIDAQKLWRMCPSARLKNWRRLMRLSENIDKELENDAIASRNEALRVLTKIMRDPESSSTEKRKAAVEILKVRGAYIERKIIEDARIDRPTFVDIAREYYKSKERKATLDAEQ